ncbi:FAD:protein FMN transferase [Deefgea sp. CFH1-16]|uniref:FAD:protein FMN transferase n=1 Tax=Deefgea sp. CFH1-16 TaxID=2675457 RepID=UPI0027DBCE06|nr:FAD:protein FMN transferase [Deefgea sp. CFH1-16]
MLNTAERIVHLTTVGIVPRLLRAARRFGGRYAWLAAGLLLSACSQPQLYTQESYVFGTRVQISIYGLEPEVAAKHANAVLKELDRLHVKLHAWQPSEVTRLNQAFARDEPALVDIELAQMIQQAANYAQRSDQLFNPAVGNLVQLWGFHQDQFAPVTPDPAALQAALAAQPSLDDLTWNGASVSSSNPQLAIDFGGFAKGWALDHSANYLRKARVMNALVNIGGNVIALGKKGGEPWVVGLQHPRLPEAMATLPLYDGEAIGTTGDYQRFFEMNGRRYSHVIDPRSGQPAQGVQAVTVLSPSHADAGTVSDVATKPMFIQGVPSALRYAQRFGIKDVLMVSANGDVYITEQLQQRLTWLKPPPHLYRLR